MYAVQCGVCDIYKKKQHPEIKSHYDKDKVKKEILAIQYANFEHCNFPMEIHDDEIHEIEEFEKYNGNRISINVYRIYKDIKKTL
jgi:hypothetical protein